MGKKSNQGLTLIEMLIVIGIIGIIGAIAYPILFLNNKLVTKELDDSLERNEVRSIANFLKEDIRDSFEIVYEDLGDPIGFRSIINQKDKAIIYTRVLGENGAYHVVRRFAGNDIHFPEIANADIKDLPNTKDLAQVSLYIKEKNEKENSYDFKIARWRWQIMTEKDEKTIYELIEEENFFVIGAGFDMQGKKVIGEGASIYVDSNLTKEDINGNTKIQVSNLYITGNVDLNGSMSLGSPTEPGEIVVDGDVTLEGSSDIYGDVYVNGNLQLEGSGKIFGNVYVQGDFDFANGQVVGDVYVDGDLAIKDGTLDGNMYVNGNASVNWTPSFAGDSLVYHHGSITHPASYDIEKFQPMATEIAVAQQSTPNVGIPTPKEEEWYVDNGYVLNGPLSDNAKAYITTGDYTQSLSKTVSNVIVANLSGDITITGGNLNLSGVIYAPEGKVTIEGKSFSGLVIAKEGANMSSGGMEVNFQDIQTYIPDPANYPFKNEV